MKRWLCGLALVVGLAVGAQGTSVKAAPAAPGICAGNYAQGPYRAGPLRFGIDPGVEGNAGSGQAKVAPINRTKELAALRALRPHARQLVLRVNRLFEADGEAGIRRFQATLRRYTRAGFYTELQVRYHPTATQAGKIALWNRYVRHVVDVFGPNRHLVAMTITNEGNLNFTPNTSDGYYPRVEQALVQGIIAGHQEALRRGDRQLKLGFTYAYRFTPAADAALFTGLRHGGSAFRRALGFVGVDYYPGLVPGPGVPIRSATLQMLGTVRRCFMPLGDLGSSVPIWITEDGYRTAPGTTTLAQQQTALTQIVQTIHGAARTFGVTDYRWFNLRDNLPRAGGLGLLSADYRRKPSFAAYRGLIERFGTELPAGR